MRGMRRDSVSGFMEFPILSQDVSRISVSTAKQPFLRIVQRIRAGALGAENDRGLAANYAVEKASSRGMMRGQSGGQ